MSDYLPPPTFADVVLVDDSTKKARFNPIWLDWFLRLAQVISGGSGGSVDHNLTSSLQGGAANQYYHLTQAGYNLVLGVQNANKVFAGPTTGADAAPTFRSLVAADGAAEAWASYTTTRTGWTDVGSPTVTARFSKAGHTCFFQIKVVPGTTVATTAGTSYCSLPVTAAGLAGDASMTDLSTFISIGNCVIDVANSRVYVPSQIATGDTILIAGWYEV